MHIPDLLTQEGIDKVYMAGNEQSMRKIIKQLPSNHLVLGGSAELTS